MCCEYFKHERPRLCFNEGWILDVVKAIFWALSRLSILSIIDCIAEKRLSLRWRYHIVEVYIAVFAAAGLIVFLVFLNRKIETSCIFLIIFIIYRLFDLFQVWVRHFVLPDWNPINVYRSLILVFIGYVEVIILYALLIHIFQNQFEGISSLQQAFDYSIHTAVTIGSSGVTPKSCCAYAIHYTQLMFVLLFLTSVVSRIIGRK